MARNTLYKMVCISVFFAHNVAVTITAEDQLLLKALLNKICLNIDKFYGV
jgi:hypothetical protein